MTKHPFMELCYDVSNEAITNKQPRAQKGSYDKKTPAFTVATVRKQTTQAQFFTQQKHLQPKQIKHFEVQTVEHRIQTTQSHTHKRQQHLHSNIQSTTTKGQEFIITTTSSSKLNKGLLRKGDFSETKQKQRVSLRQQLTTQSHSKPNQNPNGTLSTRSASTATRP